MIDAVQTVFTVAAPIAAAAFLIVLFVREVPLQTRAQLAPAKPAPGSGRLAAAEGGAPR